MNTIFKALDTDNNGKIFYNEFLAPHMDSYTENESYLAQIFKHFDKLGKGKISRVGL